MKTFEDRSHWDRSARQYQQTAHRFTSLYAEHALARAALPAGRVILDVAAGTGALTFAAAKTASRVMAIDFSPGMVAVIEEAGVANVEARVMDGQALDLPDASFDAVFSIFGVIMFPDWRKGLSEMARVTRPGGLGVVATWREQGAATFLLLGQIRKKLFPERQGVAMPEAVQALSDPADFSRALVEAGYRDPVIESVTFDFVLQTAQLAEPDTLFGMSPDWINLSQAEKESVIAEVRRLAGDREALPIPSTALIGIARR